MVTVSSEAMLLLLLTTTPQPNDVGGWCVRLVREDIFERILFAGHRGWGARQAKENTVGTHTWLNMSVVDREPTVRGRWAVGDGGGST
uniref:Putative secreted protein n=1 Tax=Anopheles darlingi TaxID=43151 RepID=A0A2M4D7S2_ANODA